MSNGVHRWWLFGDGGGGGGVGKDFREMLPVTIYDAKMHFLSMNYFLLHSRRKAVAAKCE